MINLSVIIITFRRISLLAKCLESIYQNKSFADEIIVGINGEDNESVRFLADYEGIKVIKMCQQTPGEARNRCLEYAAGEYVIFLDDDASLPGDYFCKGKQILKKYPELDVFGGPDRTPENAGFFEKALGLTLVSPLATAVTRLRHAFKPGIEHFQVSEKKLILCNLWCKRSIFCLEGYKFSADFYRNEENVLLYQLKKVGKTFGFFSDLFVFHKRKVGLFQLMKAISSSGKHRMRSFLVYSGSFEPIYVVPAFSIILGLILIIFDIETFSIAMSIYLFSSIVMAIWLVLVNRRSFFYIPLIIYFQIVINLCYGFGVLIELMTRIATNVYGLVRPTKEYPEKVK